MHDLICRKAFDIILVCIVIFLFFSACNKHDIYSNAPSPNSESERIVNIRISEPCSGAAIPDLNITIRNITSKPMLVDKDMAGFIYINVYIVTPSGAYAPIMKCCHYSCASHGEESKKADPLFSLSRKHTLSLYSLMPGEVISGNIRLSEYHNELKVTRVSRNGINYPPYSEIETCKYILPELYSGKIVVQVILSTSYKELVMRDILHSNRYSPESVCDYHYESNIVHLEYLNGDLKKTDSIQSKMLDYSLPDMQDGTNVWLDTQRIYEEKERCIIDSFIP